MNLNVKSDLRGGTLENRIILKKKTLIRNIINCELTYAMKRNEKRKRMLMKVITVPV